jgi:hypothetical protein
MKRVSFIAHLAASAILLSGCASRLPYAPPTSSAATLRFDITDLVGFLVFPDGDRCGQSFEFSPEYDPRLRSDKTLALASGKSTALWLHWQKRQPLALCSIYVSFTPSPNGTYRLVGGSEGDRCLAQIEAVPGTNTDAPVVRQMKSSRISPDLCVPRD